MLIGVILLSFPIFALDHSGTISSAETWYAGDNPHILTGDVTISDGVTLTIEAGCNVKFNGPYTLMVYGVLDADGTSGNHITFTSNAGTPAAGDWDYIYYSSADAGCVLDYCDISYGGSNYGNIFIYNTGSNLTITNSTFQQSGTSGIWIHDSSSPTISDCTIQNNATYGIYCNSTSSYPYISDCSILNNGSYAIRTYANNVKEITGSMSIIGNTYNSILVLAATVYTGTWLDHDVPYVIGGDLTVDDGDVLTIDPGCELRFNGNYQLLVYGALVADGTAADHIIFTSNSEPQSPGDWKYIYIYNNDDTCILDYCDISYGGSSYGNVILYFVWNLSITNCLIEQSGNTGFYLFSNAFPTISDNTIQDNTTHGIYISDSSSHPQISDCSILDNGSTAFRGYTNNIHEITGTMNISGNTNNYIYAYGATVYDCTWLNHNVPFIIGSSFTVNNGDTLTIAEGNTIKFDGNNNIVVYGTLVADGTPSEHITFTSFAGTPAPGDWSYIQFYNSDPGCLLDYCDFSYGGSLNGNIHLQNTDSMTISNSTFSYSGTNGIYLYDNTQPVISSSSFSNNTNNGIYVYTSSGYPSISDCTIRDNGSYAIRTYTNSLKEITGTMTVSGNGYDEFLAYGATVYTGTWLDHNVPYIITGDFAVDDGDTLTIAAGTTVKFNGNRVVTVYGAIVADGTDSEHITFTSYEAVPAPGDWRYVQFYNSDPGCLLDYCDFSYGGSLNGNIHLQNTDSMTISNSTFSYSGTNGIYLYDNTQPVISSSSFSNNTNNGIYVYTSSGYPSISDCTIRDNGSYAIRTYTNSLKEITGTMTVSGNGYDEFLAYGATVYTGTWLDHNVPYIITGDFVVDDGDTLTIDAGTEIKFNGNRTMTVYGALVADGTPSEHITFTSYESVPAPGDWRYVHFYVSEPGSMLDYCDFSYGGSLDGNIKCQTTDAFPISNCSFTNSQTAGIYLRENSDPIISDCLIEDNQTYGIRIFSNTCDPQISDCTVQNNGSYAILTYADNLKDISGTMSITGNAHNSIRAYGENISTGTWQNHGVPYDFAGTVNVNDGSVLTITAGDTIRFDGNYGLTVYGQLSANGTDSEHIVFTRSPTYAGNWQHVYFYFPYGTCNMDYCDLTYGGSNAGMVYFRGASNYVDLDYCTVKYSDNSGLYIIDNSDPSIENCVITANTGHGIQVSGSCEPTFGSDPTEWNDIYNNGTYDLYNGNEDITANYVFWGDDDPSYIETRIYHYPDYSSLGWVDYSPWSSSPHGEMPCNEHAGLITADSPDCQKNWTLANGSIHYVTAPVTVDNGVTVTIEDGVEVRFTEGTSISVNGMLDADASTGITFTRYEMSVDWGGIWFESGSSGTLDNCLIEYATYNDGYGIYAADTSPTITNNTVQYSDYGFYADGAIPSTFSGNTFSENSTGMYFNGVSSPALSSANTTDNNSAVGLHFYNCSATSSISNQTITNHTGTLGAIYMETCHQFELGTGNTITGNLFPLTINIASYAGSGSSIPTSGNTNNAIQVYGGTTASNFYWYDFSIPYIVTVDPTIDAGDLLEISSGINVQFENGKRMNIYGTLNAAGTGGNEIYFTRNDSTDTWQGLNFQHGASGDFDYSYIQYATYSNGYAIYADSTNLNLDNCVIQYNDYGLYGEEQQTTMTSTIFQNNTYGYYVQNTENPNANFGIGNVFSDNTNLGIYYKDCSSLGTIENLTLQNNEGYGAFLIANSGSFVYGTNTVSGNSWALCIDAGSFPDLTSNIPTSGNSNNDIRVTSGTGTKTGTWQNFTDLNYIVTDSPTLGATGSLTIAEGDSIKFNTNRSFDIYGTFNAVGNEIVFTGNEGAQWNGLRCLNGSTANIDSCLIEYATYSTSYGIYVNQCSPNISNCTIRLNDYGVYADNGTPVLSGNNIDNNTYGIHYRNTASVNLNTTNTIDNNSTAGIYFYNCSGTPNISNQTITNNVGSRGAIYIQSCGTFSLGTNTITGNYFPLTFTVNSYPDDPSLANIPTSGNVNDDVQVVESSTGATSITWKNLPDPLDYIVTGNITISNGGTLTILDEIDVYFEYQKLIYVYGTLNCQGTGTRESEFYSTRYEVRVEENSDKQTNSDSRSNPLNSTKLSSSRNSELLENSSKSSSTRTQNSRDGNPELSSTRTSYQVESGSRRSPGILFSKWDVDDSWQGVRFQNSASGDLDYLTVEYANYGASYGVYTINPTALTIDNCSFQNCYYGFYGDNVPPATLTSFSNIETVNNTIGIYIKNTTGRSLDNTISSTLNDNGIYFHTCNSPSVDAVIEDNLTYGVIFSVCDSPAITSDVNNCGNGIYYSGCTNLGTIDNLTVTNNSGDYGAFRISDSGDFLLGSSNIITGNSWALSIDCGSFPDPTSTIPAAGNTNNDIQVIAGSGNNTGTWHLFSGFDYIVTGSPDLNGELTIADGNTLKFNNGIYFNIDGTLLCPGTSGNGITFTRDATFEWYGIRCQPYSTVDFDYCTIEYATHGNYYAVVASNGVSFNHCLIRYNDTGVYGNTVDVEFLSNNQIINNNNYGIYFDNNSNPTFGSSLTEWNDLYGNGVQDFRNGTADVTVEYVYWGTEVYSEVEDRIYDQNENGSLGIVDFVPYTNAAHDTEFLGEIDAPENVIISVDADSVYLEWDPVDGATSYNIYSSDDPYAVDWGTAHATGITGTNWSEAIFDVKKFYYVVAVN